MTDSSHWTDCWLIHPACCIARVHQLQSEIKRLKAEREPHTFTGPMPIPCHDRLPGATWTHPIADEPPVALHAKSYLL